MCKGSYKIVYPTMPKNAFYYFVLLLFKAEPVDYRNFCAGIIIVNCDAT